MRVVSFKLWGDYAHFRKHFTTSSPLTHSIPPPSALRGLVGAILGYSRGEYIEKFSLEKSRFGIRILSPIKKVRIGINLMDTKDGSWVQVDFSRCLPIVKEDGHGNPRLHTQVRTEFLKDPVFEIFFHHQDDALMDKFSGNLREHKAVYTPFLGITECIANFEFLWDEEVDDFHGVSEVLSAFKVDDLEELKLDGKTGIIKESIPIFINEERIRELSKEVLFNPNGNPVRAEIKEGWRYPKGKGVFGFLG